MHELLKKNGLSVESLEKAVLMQVRVVRVMLMQMRVMLMQMRVMLMTAS